MGLIRQSRLSADRAAFIVALWAMGCVFLSSTCGTATAQNLTSPTNGAVVSGTITLSCSAVANVEWLNFDVDGYYYASSSAYAPSYTTTWNSASVGNGSHSITCTGYSSSGSLLIDSIAYITVSNGSSSGVQLTSPSNGAAVSGTINLSCSVPSSVEWINLDVDGYFYASGSAWVPSYTTTWNSASVGNGSHSITCAGYASTGALVGNSIANITVGGSSSTSPPPAGPTGANCTTIPGTSTPVGASCFPSSSYPALNNPQNPVSYGADSSGYNDSTAAINAALANGDAYFSTPGTYLVSLSSGHGIKPPAGRTIECAPGVTLIQNAQYASNDVGILSLEYGGNTVVGCNFQGASSASGAFPISSQGLFLIIVASSNDTIEGNTFQNGLGNSAIQVNKDYSNIVPANFMIQYNTFSHNAYYGPTVATATSGTMQNNLQIDGALGVEDNFCGSSYPVGNVLIRNNELTTSVGDCYVAGQNGCDGDAFISGGNYPPGCNYSTVTVNYNYCQGNATQAAAISNNFAGSGVSPASYGGDILGPSCYCWEGSTC
jgi:hypothetical protein